VPSMPGDLTSRLGSRGIHGSSLAVFSRPAQDFARSPSQYSRTGEHGHVVGFAGLRIEQALTSDERHARRMSNKAVAHRRFRRYSRRKLGSYSPWRTAVCVGGGRANGGDDGHEQPHLRHLGYTVHALIHRGLAEVPHWLPNDAVVVPSAGAGRGRADEESRLSFRAEGRRPAVEESRSSR
jgi:hypothetical protein